MSEQTNVDELELNKFNRSSEDWWSTDGAFRTLHHLNATRVEFIAKKANLSGCRLLDVGCGGGILSEGLAERGAVVTGIDLAEQALQVAKAHATQSNANCEYHCSSVEDWAEKHSHQYDVVTCLEMLEHVPDPAAIVKACFQAVKPGGFVFFSTLNRTVQAYLFAIVGAEYILGLLPKQTHDYDKFIQPSELAAWCRNAGFTVQSMQGMSYNPWTKTANLTDSLNVNYLLVAQAEILETIS